MVLTSWLKLFYSRLKFHSRGKRYRRRKNSHRLDVSEALEARILLSAVAVDDVATVDVSGEPVEIDLLANDYSTDASQLTLNSVVMPDFGMVEYLADDGTVVADVSQATTLRYTPDSAYVGTVQFSYEVTDGSGVDFGQVMIDVTDANSVVDDVNDAVEDAIDDVLGTNDLPVANDDTFTIGLDEPTQLDVLVNDYDPDGDELRVASVGQAENGSVALLPEVEATVWNEWLSTGTGFSSFEDWYTSYWGGDSTALAYGIQYTPDAGFSGTDSFTYTIDDGWGGQATATASINVQGNIDPEAINDSLTTNYETASAINVLANDTDLDGDTLSIQSTTNGANGTVSILPDVDSTVWEDWQTTGAGFSSFEDWYSSYWGGDSESLQYVLQYTPDAGFSGQDSFQYTLVDEHGATSVGTVSVTVNSPSGNSSPLTVDDVANTIVSSPAVIDVLANDSDPENDSLSISSVGTAMNGSTEKRARVDASVWSDWESTGSGFASFEDWYANYWGGDVSTLQYDIVYTPDNSFVGTDSFTYTATDSSGGQSTSLVTVSVSSPAAPVANNDSFTTEFETSFVVNVLSNDSDPGGGELTIIAFGSGANGTVSLRPIVDQTTWDSWSNSNSGYATFEDWYTAEMGGDPSALTYGLEYTPGQGFSGTDSFSYTVQNSLGELTTATVYVTVAEHSVVDEIEETLEEIEDAVGDATDTGDGSSSSGDSSGSDGSSSNQDPPDTTGDDPPVDGSGIEDEIGGSGGSSGNDETTGDGGTDGTPPPDDPNVETVSVITLESGLTVDPYAEFVLPVDQRGNDSTTESGTDLIDESVVEDGITYTTTGQTDWTLTTTKVDNDLVWSTLDLSSYPDDYDFVGEFGPEWSYSEIYTAVTTTETIGSDGSTATALSTYDYTLTAWEVGDEYFYTITMDWSDDLSGSYSETWNDVDDEGLADTGTWNIDWTLLSTEMLSIVMVTNQVSGTGIVTTTTNSTQAATTVGAGTYQYDVTGGDVSGTLGMNSSTTDNSSFTITEEKDSEGKWLTSSGNMSGSGSSQFSDWFTGAGTYLDEDETSKISGTITESGNSSENDDYASTSVWQSDDTWKSTSGTTNFSGSSTSSYSYEGAGTYADAANQTAGTIDESGSATATDQYAGGAVVDAEGKWIGSMTADGDSNSTSLLEIAGTYAYDVEGGAVSGTSKFTASTSDASEYDSAAILNDEEEWELASGSTTANGNSSVISSYEGAGTYADDLAVDPDAADDQENPGENTGDPDGETASSKSGIVSGTIDESGNSYDTTTYAISYSVDTTTHEWSLDSGSSTQLLGDEATYAFTGSGNYTSEIDGGTTSGSIDESGSVNDKFDATFTDILNADEEWETVSGTSSISGSFDSKYSYSGAGSYQTTTPEVSASGTVTESGLANSNGSYSASADLVITPPDPPAEGADPEEASEPTFSWNWTEGTASSNSETASKFNLQGTGTISLDLDGGGFTGTSEESFIIDDSSTTTATQIIQEDGTWINETGNRVTNEYLLIASVMTGTATVSSDDTDTQTDLDITVLIDSNQKLTHDMNLVETIDDEGEWEKVSGIQNDFVFTEDSTTISGTGTTVTGDFDININIDGGDEAYFSITEKREIVNNDWEVTEGKMTTTDNSDMSVEYDGGGTTQSGVIATSVTIAGSSSTDSGHFEEHTADKEGKYTFLTGTKSDEQSESYDITYSGSGTDSTAVDGGVLNSTISTSGSSSFSSDQSISEVAIQGTWQDPTGTSNFSISDTHDFSTVSSGLLTPSVENGSNLTTVSTSSTSGSQFSQDESYKLAPPDNDDGNSAEGNWVAESGSRSFSSYDTSNTDVHSSIIETSSTPTSSFTNNTDLTYSSSEANSQNYSQTLNTDETWSASTGGKSYSTSTKQDVTTTGGGTYSYEIDGGTVNGTISTTGTSLDHSSEATEHSINGDGTYTLVTGSKISQKNITNTSESTGSGTYTLPIPDGTISGTVTESSSSQSQSEESLLGSAVMGGAWGYTGGKTAGSNSSSDFNYSGNGTYSSTTNDSSTGTTTTRSGTAEENGTSHSSSNYFEIWSLDILTGEFGTGTGQKTESFSSEQHSSSEGTGTYTVDHSKTETEGSTTTTTSRDGSGTSNESYSSSSYNDSASAQSLLSDGTWNQDSSGQTSSSNWTQHYDSTGTITVSSEETVTTGTGATQGGSSTSSEGTSTETYIQDASGSQSESTDNITGLSSGQKSSKLDIDSTSSYSGSGDYSSSSTTSDPTPSDGTSNTGTESISGEITLDKAYTSYTLGLEEGWGYSGMGADWVQTSGTKSEINYADHHRKWNGSGDYEKNITEGAVTISVTGTITEPESESKSDSFSFEDFDYLAGQWQQVDGLKTSSSEFSHEQTSSGSGTITYTVDDTKSGRNGTASGTYSESSSNGSENNQNSTDEWDSEANEYQRTVDFIHSTTDATSTGGGTATGSYKMGPIQDGTITYTSTNTYNYLDDWTKKLPEQPEVGEGETGEGGETGSEGGEPEELITGEDGYNYSGSGYQNSNTNISLNYTGSGETTPDSTPPADPGNFSTTFNSLTENLDSANSSVSSSTWEVEPEGHKLIDTTRTQTSTSDGLVHTINKTQTVESTPAAPQEPDSDGNTPPPHPGGDYDEFRDETITVDTTIISSDTSTVTTQSLVTDYSLTGSTDENLVIFDDSAHTGDGYRGIIGDLKMEILTHSVSTQQTVDSDSHWKQNSDDYYSYNVEMDNLGEEASGAADLISVSQDGTTDYSFDYTTTVDNWGGETKNSSGTNLSDDSYSLTDPALFSATDFISGNQNGNDKFYENAYFHQDVMEGQISVDFQALQDSFAATGALAPNFGGPGGGQTPSEPRLTDVSYNPYIATLQGIGTGLADGAENVGNAFVNLGLGLKELGLMGVDIVGNDVDFRLSLLGVDYDYPEMSAIGQQIASGELTVGQAVTQMTWGQVQAAWTTGGRFFSGEMTTDEVSQMFANIGVNALVSAVGLRGTKIGGAPIKQVPGIAAQNVKNAVKALPFKKTPKFTFDNGAKTFADVLDETRSSMGSKFNVVGDALENNGWFHNCFVSGTPVLMANGQQKPIEEVQAGEFVQAYNHATEEWEPKQVLGLAQHVHEGDFVRISVAGEVIESTYHHPYWVVDGNDLQSRPAPDHIASIEQTATGPGRWVDAGDLKPSDLLLLHNGTHAFVESIKFEFRAETTYNFEVDGHHNYAVGDTRILVHNNSGWWKHQLEEWFDDGGVQILTEKRAGIRGADTHHIATTYGEVGKRLSQIFENAGLSLEGWYNKVDIEGHQGPHGYYNEIVLNELQDAVHGQTPGTKLYSQKVFSKLVELRSRLKEGGDLLPLVTTSTTWLERIFFRK